jgi:hypothetical protein
MKLKIKYRQHDAYEHDEYGETQEVEAIYYSPETEAMVEITTFQIRKGSAIESLAEVKRLAKEHCDALEARLSERRA